VTLTICTEEPRETAGPASTSKPSNDGARKVSSSGEALSENSTRKASPTATVSGDDASKLTFPAPHAVATSSRRSPVRDIFDTSFLIT